MPTSPIKPAPRTAYVEDCDDSDDEKTPAAPPIAANTARKVTRRDEASDSGYSSRTFATGSSSQGSKKKGSSERSSILKVFSMGKKSSSTAKKTVSDEKVPEKEKPATSKTVRRHSISRTQKKEDLKASAHANKDKTAERRSKVPPIDTKIIQNPKSSHPTTAPPTRSPQPVVIPAQSMPIAPLDTRPRPYPTFSRQRPYSYHGGSAMMYQQPPQYQYANYGAPPVMNSAAPMYHPGQPQLFYAPGPHSPNRIINYNMPPTQPPGSYFPPAQGPLYYHDPQPMAPSRRFSMAATSGSAVVQYPMVPARHAGGSWMGAPVQQSMGPSGYVTPIESPAYVGEQAVYDEEEFYRVKSENDRRTMPPPQRPSLERSATTSATQGALRRSQRQSIEIPTKSSRKSSLDKDRHSSPTKTETTTRASTSGNGTRNEIASTEAPRSPTLRRTSKTISSRPTSMVETTDKHNSKLQEAEAYQHAQSGSANPTVTHDDLQKFNRKKSGSKSRSSRSEVSRMSSKNSETRKSRHGHTERSQSRREPDSVTVKAGGKEFEVLIRSESEARDKKLGFLHRGEGVRHIPATDDYTRAIEPGHSSNTRSRSQRRKSTTDSVLSPVGESDYYYDTVKRTESRSRRSSRSTNGSRRVLRREDFNHF